MNSLMRVVKQVGKFVWPVAAYLPLSSPVVAADDDVFHRYQASLPFNLTHRPMVVDLLPQDGPEIIALGVNAEGQRQLAILQLNLAQQRLAVLELINLGAQFFAIDSGEVDRTGLQSLYLLSNKQIWRYQAAPQQAASPVVSVQAPGQATLPALAYDSRFAPLLQVQTMYLAQSAPTLVVEDFAQNINEDGHDDFVFAQFEQMHFWLSDGQEQPGKATDYVLQALPIASLFSTKDSEFHYQPQAVRLVDMDLDSRPDVTLVEPGKLLVYPQLDSGQFAAKPYILPLSAEIEGIQWWDKVDEDGMSLDQSQLMHQSVEDIVDINGDSLPDLVVKVTRSSGVLDRYNDYDFYYAQQGEGGQMYYRIGPSSRIQSSATLSDLQLADIDNDGKQEAMLAAFDLGISQIISALLSSSIDQQALLFQLDNNLQFPSKPDFTQDVELTFSLSSGRSGQPLVRLLDINGDGFRDLVFADGTEQLRVLWGSADAKRLFARRAARYPLTLAKNSSLMVDHDLNRDGKVDLLMHYTRADPAGSLNKLVVLIAN